MDAKNLEAIEDICRFQLRRDLHPLTCGIDSGHGRLFPAVEDSTGKLILACPDCDYRQHHVPLSTIRGMLAGQPHPWTGDN